MIYCNIHVYIYNYTYTSGYSINLIGTITLLSGDTSTTSASTDRGLDLWYRCFAPEQLVLSERSKLCIQYIYIWLVVGPPL